MFRRTRHIHFVGIGGIGMSGIAEVLINLDYVVSGSDLRASATTTRLVAMGAQIQLGHAPENVQDAHVVVISSAVRSDNVEVLAARDRGITVIPRAEMLAELMRMKHGLAVAGTHGKTTTTSMLADVFFAGGMDPTVVVGGKLNSVGTNAVLGRGDWLVAEADESDGSFLKLSPTIAIVTNIDPEHLDHYGDEQALRAAFLQFINRVPFYGAAVLCLDHPAVQEIIPHVTKRYVTYGFGSQADFCAASVRVGELASTFAVIHQGQLLGEVALRMPGRHNVLNALATIAAAMEADVPFGVVQKALGDFEGVQRRFTVRGAEQGITVVDDYGHHPVEIRATLAAAREGYRRRIIAVWQPHRYSRVEHLWEQFMTAFNDSDLLVVLDVYPAGEQPLAGIDSARLCRELKHHGHKGVIEAGTSSEALGVLTREVQRGDVVITLGAGDVTRLSHELLEALRSVVPQA